VAPVAAPAAAVNDDVPAAPPATDAAPATEVESQDPPQQ
jgi:hypothetical protein